MARCLINKKYLTIGKIKQISRELKWKCHLPQLFEEILLSNDKMGALKIPINYTKQILAEVAERCIEVNDPILNELMCDLQLYETPPISSDEYRAFMKKVRAAAAKQKQKEVKKSGSK